MRFRIEHPEDATIVGYAGFDPVVGFFADVHHGPKVKSLDVTLDHPLNTVLRWFAEWGFYDHDDLDDALILLHEGEPIPVNLKLVVGVVTELKLAADQG